MASSNNDEITSLVSPHTIKKFKLIETYVVAWAHKMSCGNKTIRYNRLGCISMIFHRPR